MARKLSVGFSKITLLTHFLALHIDNHDFFIVVQVLVVREGVWVSIASMLLNGVEIWGSHRPKALGNNLEMPK